MCNRTLLHLKATRFAFLESCLGNCYNAACKHHFHIQVEICFSYSSDKIFINEKTDLLNPSGLSWDTSKSILLVFFLVVPPKHILPSVYEEKNNNLDEFQWAIL